MEARSSRPRKATKALIVGATALGRPCPGKRPGDWANEGGRPYVDECLVEIWSSCCDVAKRAAKFL